MNSVRMSFSPYLKYLTIAGLLLGLPFISFAQIIYKVNTNDTDFDGVCDDVHCSLVEAMVEANTDNSASTIIFEDISGPINLDNPLPVIVEPKTIIDAANGHELGEIIISGDALTDGIGIRIQDSDDCEIKGLTFFRFQTGVQVDNLSREAKIGTSKKGNWFIECVIGIDIIGPPFGDSEIEVKGNYIGTDTLGLLDLTDQNALFTEGIRVGVRDVEIGGYGDAEMNTIGFLERGIYYSNELTEDVRVDPNVFVCNDIPIEAEDQNNQTTDPPEILYATPEIFKGTAYPGSTVEVYLSGDVNCPDKPCQGRVYLGKVFADIITEEWELDVSGFTNLRIGDFVTATARREEENTSGFAFCKEVEWGCKGTSRAADSTRLDFFYNQQGGSSWSYSQTTFWQEGFIFDVPNAGQAWDAGSPIDTWHGVELDREGCVESLILNNVDLKNALSEEIYQLKGLETIILTNNEELQGTLSPLLENWKGVGYLDLSFNDLEGTLPTELAELTNLEVLNLSNNTIGGTFPKIANVPLKTLRINQNQFTGILELDSVSTWSNVTVAGCRVDNNRLTFEDILPNMGVEQIGTWVYAPQDSIFVESPQCAFEGEDWQLDLGIDLDITTSSYQWFFNGDSLTTNSSSLFEIDSVEVIDAGFYHCEITNPGAPDLTLYSTSFKLEVKPPPIDTIFNYFSVCDADEVSLEPDTIILQDQFQNDSLAIIEVTTTASPISSDGLVASFLFDGTNQDLSGNGNELIVNGATLTADRFGNPGFAYFLDGNNDVLVIPHTHRLDFDMNDDFTISLWFKASEQIDFSRKKNIILNKWEGNDESYPFSIGISNALDSLPGQIIGSEYGGVICDETAELRSPIGIDFRDGGFHHLVYRKSGMNQELYVDGVFAGENQGLLDCEIANNAPLFIGRQGNDSGDKLFFTGVVDDIRIYNRELVFQEIQDLYLEEKQYSFTVMIDTLVCQGEELVVNGVSYDSSGVYFDSLYTDNGCLIDWVIDAEFESLLDLRADTIALGEVAQVDGYQVLSNDIRPFLLSELPTIVTPPENGTARFNADGTLFYSFLPSSSFLEDQLQYAMCADGACGQICDTTTVYIIRENSIFQFGHLLLSPNGDGFNDLLIFEGLEEVFGDQAVELFVVNRYGDLIFHRERYLNNWDGMIGGKPLPDGTYRYLLRVGNEIQFKNLITVLSKNQ